MCYSVDTVCFALYLVVEWVRGRVIGHGSSHNGNVGGATLRADGVHVIEPEVGELASHLVGRGRMEEPEKIAAVLDDFFSEKQTLAGKKVLRGWRHYHSIGPYTERHVRVPFAGIGRKELAHHRASNTKGVWPKKCFRMTPVITAG